MALLGITAALAVGTVHHFAGSASDRNTVVIVAHGTMHKSPGYCPTAIFYTYANPDERRRRASVDQPVLFCMSVGDFIDGFAASGQTIEDVPNLIPA